MRTFLINAMVTLWLWAGAQSALAQDEVRIVYTYAKDAIGTILDGFAQETGIKSKPISKNKMT